MTSPKPAESTFSTYQTFGAQPCGIGTGARRTSYAVTVATRSRLLHTMTLLKIEESVLDAVLAACRAAYPLEACGLLGGRESRAASHFHVPNVAADPISQFDMDPQGLIDALGAMDARSEELVAIYHSHPHTAPVPSKADIEQAFYPDAYCLIVGMASPRPEIRAFRLNRERGRAVEVHWMKVADRR